MGKFQWAEDKLISRGHNISNETASKWKYSAMTNVQVFLHKKEQQSLKRCSRALLETSEARQDSSGKVNKSKNNIHCFWITGVKPLKPLI